MKTRNIIKLVLLVSILYTTIDILKAQEHFSYHPQSILFLGKTFDRTNMSLDTREALSYDIESLEQGELESSFDVFIAVDETKIKKTLNFDLSINAHYLKYSGKVKTDLVKKNDLNSKSIFVIINGKVLYGRKALKNIKLLPEAKDLLDKGEMKTFKTQFGTSFISQVKSGIDFHIVLTINSVSEETYEKFHAMIDAKAGFKKAGVDIKNEITKEIVAASSSGRLNFSYQAHGGKISFLEPIIKNIFYDQSSDYFNKLMSSVSEYIKNMDGMYAIPIEFSSASFETFGYKPNSDNIWNDYREKAIMQTVDEYYNAAALISKINDALEDSRYENILDADKRLYYTSVLDSLESFQLEMIKLNDSIKNNNIGKKFAVLKLTLNDEILPSIPTFYVCQDLGGFGQYPMSGIYPMGNSKYLLYSDINLLSSFSILKNIRIYKENVEINNLASVLKLQDYELLNKRIHPQLVGQDWVINLACAFNNQMYTGLPSAVCEIYLPYPDNTEVNQKIKDGFKSFKYNYYIEIETLFGKTKYPIRVWSYTLDEAKHQYLWNTEETCAKCIDIKSQRIEINIDPLYIATLDTLDSLSIGCKIISSNADLNKKIDVIVQSIPVKELREKYLSSNLYSPETSVIYFSLNYKMDKYELYWDLNKKFKLSDDKKSVINFYKKLTIDFKGQSGTKTVFIN